jgi:hypothetical protein
LLQVSPTGTFTLNLGVNEILTLTTLDTMRRGDDSPGPDLGLAGNKTPLLCAILY